LKISTGTSYK